MATKTLARAAEFLRNAKVKDRHLLDRVGIPEETLQEWDRRTIDAVDVLTGVGKSAVAGTATAAGVYGLVGALGTASTGTAISTLSGAAASNATLAFLGGGSLAAGGGGMALGSLVLGGAVAGPAILVAGFFMESRVEVVEREVEQKCGEYDVATEEIETRSSQLSAANRRADEIGQNIQRAVQHTETLIGKRSPTVETDAYDVYTAATSLASLIDTPVIPAK